MYQLSAKEMYRLTDSRDIDEQIVALKKRGIHYNERRIQGHGMLIGLNVYNTEVQKQISPAHWQAIAD